METLEQMMTLNTLYRMPAFILKGEMDKWAPPGKSGSRSGPGLVLGTIPVTDPRGEKRFNVTHTHKE